MDENGGVLLWLRKPSYIYNSNVGSSRWMNIYFKIPIDKTVSMLIILGNHQIKWFISVATNQLLRVMMLCWASEHVHHRRSLSNGSFLQGRLTFAPNSLKQVCIYIYTYVLCIYIYYIYMYYVYVYNIMFYYIYIYIYMYILCKYIPFRTCLRVAWNRDCAAFRARRHPHPTGRNCHLHLGLGGSMDHWDFLGTHTVKACFLALETKILRGFQMFSFHKCWMFDVDKCW